MLRCDIFVILALLLYILLNVPKATIAKTERKKISITRFKYPIQPTTTRYMTEEQTITEKIHQSKSGGGQNELREPTEEYIEAPLQALVQNISKEEQVGTVSPPYQQPQRRPESITEDRLDLPHTAGSIQTLLQRTNDRLTTIEALENQQLRKLDTIDYRITRLEVLSQEKSGADKTDDQVGRKIENIEWEINKVRKQFEESLLISSHLASMQGIVKYGTLLDVIRQDLDKIQQRQTELKVALTSNTIQSLVSSRSSSATDRSDVDDPLLHSTAAADMPNKLQVIANQVQLIKKATDTLQTVVYGIGRNLTDVNNMTRILFSNSQQTLTKQYFNIALKEIPSLRQVPSMTINTCSQEDGGNEKELKRELANDCAELKQQGQNASGIYRIKPQGILEPMFVYCDMESDGGGWTVIQKRVDGTINFYREWLDYKYGFGNAAGEYWLGNENIYHITKDDLYQLHIELEDFDGVKAKADYSSFALGSENDGYMIKLLGTYSGDAGDSLTYHASMKFSTKDMDNDHWTDGNCAETHTGGWWYKGCDTANLNGQYLAGEIPESMHYQGVYWYEWHGPEYSLHKTVMKIRPATFKTKVIDNND